MSFQVDKAYEYIITQASCNNSREKTHLLHINTSTSLESYKSKSSLYKFEDIQNGYLLIKEHLKHNKIFRYTHFLNGIDWVSHTQKSLLAYQLMVGQVKSSGKGRIIWEHIGQLTHRVIFDLQSMHKYRNQTNANMWLVTLYPIKIL